MPEHKIILSADTPCDIGPELKERYGVSLFPLHILLGDKQYTDGMDITNEEIYNAWWERKLLPRTAAINPEEYVAYFKPWVERGYDILHFSLGSGLSCSFQNAKIAADNFAGSVYVMDSCSLSTGFGLLVCEAGERVQRGMSAREIYDEVLPLAQKTSASFVLDTLEFMRAGGRCSGFLQMSADALSLKPTIVVRNERNGSMTVGKKYMGHLDRALLKYVDDQLKGRDDIVLDRVFITYSSAGFALADIVEQRVRELQPFREVHRTVASATISSHCGPNTLGVLFLTK